MIITAMSVIKDCIQERDHIYWIFFQLGLNHLILILLSSSGASSAASYVSDISRKYLASEHEHLIPNK